MCVTNHELGAMSCITVIDFVMLRTEAMYLVTSDVFSDAPLCISHIIDALSSNNGLKGRPIANVK